MNNICNNYQKNLIKNLSKNNINFLKKIVNYIINTKINKGNYILILLIYNYFNSVKPNFKMISGPCYLSYYTSSLYNKKIYIFGEYHGLTNPCNKIVDGIIYNYNTNINLYLKSLFINTSVFIDFYMETPTTYLENRYLSFRPIVASDYLNKIQNKILHIHKI